VAYTIFELDQFTPSEVHHLADQDALLVCSEWARQVCLDNGVAGKPIHVVPLGVDRTVFHENVKPRTTWSETVFMQIGKLESRKGQLELLRAFEAAFTPRDSVRLVLSCGNPFITRAEQDALLEPFRLSPMGTRITLLTNELPSLHDVAALMASADCGVFPSRAEGWNLEALEMLSMGKPVIATSCTAHTEYLNRDNARLIVVDGFEAVPSGVGQWAAWGARQHEQLVTHLRDVHERKQQVGVARNDSGIRTAQRYSWQHSVDALVRALDAIV
jgi:glycosyltransferase involved in cell wall biosynthesis